MVGGIESLSIFSAVSPLEAAASNAVPESEEKDAPDTATVLNPGNSPSVDPSLSNSFVPVPDSGFLAPDTTQVLLTAQAGEPPAILEDLESQAAFQALEPLDADSGFDDLDPLKDPAAEEAPETAIPENSKSESPEETADAPKNEPAQERPGTQQQIQSFEIAASLANGQSSTSFSTNA